MLRNLKVVYLVNSGSEANDMTMMMARLYAAYYDIVALRNAYHGLSAATMAAARIHMEAWDFSGIWCASCCEPEPISRNLWCGWEAICGGCS